MDEEKLCIECKQPLEFVDAMVDCDLYQCANSSCSEWMEPIEFLIEEK